MNTLLMGHAPQHHNNVSPFKLGFIGSCKYQLKSNVDFPFRYAINISNQCEGWENQSDMDTVQEDTTQHTGTIRNIFNLAVTRNKKLN